MGNELDAAVQDYVEVYKKSEHRADEAWRRDHEEVKKVWRLEELIRCGIFLSQYLEDLLAKWRDAVASGLIAYSDEFNSCFTLTFRSLIIPENSIRTRIEEMKEKGFSIRGADELLTRFEKTRAILRDWVPPVLSTARGQHAWEMTREEAEELDRIIKSGEAKIRVPAENL
jgi:hypothetical protein